MRRHSLLSRYAPLVEPQRLARVVQAEYLVSARLQPSYYTWGEAWIDLVFSRDGEIALLPFVQVDPPMILVREASCMVWPSWLPLEESAVDALERKIEPWLLSHGLVGALDEEVIGFFTEDAELRAAFEEARAARFLCAAPSEVVLTAAAPYIYAQRFASGRRVGIRSADAAYGACVLARNASAVYADLGDARMHALARAWYGIGIYGDLPQASFDVFIGPQGANGATVSISLDPQEGDTLVELARPVFPLIASSFDPADAAPTRRFSARAREPIVHVNRLAAAPVIGGSSGRIGVVIRDDGLIAPEADVDAARNLAEALRAQGFDARVSVATAARASEFDLLHFFGHRHAHQFAPVLNEAKRLNVPVVVTPFFDDFSNEALWGSAAIRTMLAGIRDDATQQTVERGIVERRLLLDPEFERGKPSYEPSDVQRLFSEARSALFATVAEEAEVRKRFSFAGSSRIAPAVPSGPSAPEPIGALTGLDEFMLVHAAVESRANQWNAVRAAAAIGIPCILVGPVEDSEYYQNVLEVAGPGTVWLAEDRLRAGQLEALYAAARVFADLSWAGHGPARLIRAAAYGAVPVFSAILPYAELWPEASGGCDPASLESAVTVVRQAWMRAPSIGYQIAARTADRCDPLRSLQAVLGAYAEAAAVRA